MPSSGSFSPQEEASPVRLDSWKAIAAYLGRGERTAKRWEVERALPVHRLPGGGRGSVFAIASELDEWLLSAKAQEVQEAGPADLARADRESEADESAEFSGPPPPNRIASLPRHQDSSTDLPMTAGEPVSSWRMPLYLTLIATIVLAGYFFIHRHGPIAVPAQPKQAPSDGIPVSSPADRQLAHELYLKGRFEWNKRNPDSLNRALDDFTQAVVHDPADAQAYVGLADTYNLLREDALMPENEAYHRAIAASRKAVQLDDSLAEAHRSLAFDEFWGDWDFKASQKEFRRAMELDPRDPLTHLWFANAFAGPDWFPLCFREMNRAQELDPASPVVLAGKGLLLINSGQAQQGIDLLEQVTRTDPGLPGPHRFLANVFFAQKRYPDFLIENKKLAELTRDPVLLAVTDAAREGFNHGGEAAMLERLYTAQQKFYADGDLQGAVLARTCVRLGRKNEALALLRTEFERHGASFLTIRADLVLNELKDEPEYKELIAKLQFPASDTDLGQAAHGIESPGASPAK
jgi:tetratricopeptide (TPR) repeat protein